MRIQAILIAASLVMSGCAVDGAEGEGPFANFDNVLDGVVETAERVDRVCDIVAGAPSGVPDAVTTICLLAKGLASPAIAPTDALAACARTEPLVREDDFSEMYRVVCEPLLTKRADTALRAATFAIGYMGPIVGEGYVPPPVVLFKAGTETPCGSGQGSRYCPADRRVYLDVEQLARFDGVATTESGFLAGTFGTVVHEIVHNGQHQMGELKGYGYHAEVTYRVEAGADCHTGAAARVFDASDSQLAAGRRWVSSIGGATRGSHGTGGMDGERVANALRGYNGDDCSVDAVPI